MAKNLQSVEPNIVDLANRWLKSYELDYKLEQESLNDEINRAVDDCFSKNGGKLVEIGQMLNFFYRIGIFDIYPQTDLPCQ